MGSNYASKYHSRGLKEQDLSVSLQHPQRKVMLLEKLVIIFFAIWACQAFRVCNITNRQIKVLREDLEEAVKDEHISDIYPRFVNVARCGGFCEQQFTLDCEASAVIKRKFEVRISLCDIILNKWVFQTTKLK